MHDGFEPVEWRNPCCGDDYRLLLEVALTTNTIHELRIRIFRGCSPGAKHLHAPYLLRPLLWVVQEPNTLVQRYCGVRIPLVHSVQDVDAVAASSSRSREVRGGIADPLDGLLSHF